MIIVFDLFSKAIHVNNELLPGTTFLVNKSLVLIAQMEEVSIFLEFVQARC